MDDTDKPDPILKQVPLIKNPSYQPPKAITLNTNFNKLLPTLSNTVVPPQLKITDDDINEWVKELNEFKKNLVTDSKNGTDLKKWINEESNKVAPGFSYDILKPTK
ncbi:uncharacterized protein KGF55_003287 [Candida pseudojiufengensis]|uniref:uncharacterized protein n=1 Tax=Candida pseudojiufengensis TaxID=497109 RepID=UPI0022254A0C|nr:uncharacterized protein KGF55_003287 [Candida pseudojiufengensis]KAI5962211.1 hypothetical protein KGF55_003287 [Candida pseudojiufengensis]